MRYLTSKSRRDLFLLALVWLLSPSLSARTVLETYTTARGISFQKVDLGRFGVGWRDPSRLTWSRNLGLLPLITSTRISAGPQKSAAAACSEIGGRLARLEEYRSLFHFFFRTWPSEMTALDWKDFRHLLPDAFDSTGQPLMFWAIGDADPGQGRFIKGADGFGDVTFSARKLNVRCVL